MPAHAWKLGYYIFSSLLSLIMYILYSMMSCLLYMYLPWYFCSPEDPQSENPKFKNIFLIFVLYFLNIVVKADTWCILYSCIYLLYDYVSSIFRALGLRITDRIIETISPHHPSPATYGVTSRDLHPTTKVKVTQVPRVAVSTPPVTMTTISMSTAGVMAGSVIATYGATSWLMHPG